MMTKPLYIGSFPPPYGGVTVKNALLFEAVSEKMPIDKLNLMDVKKHDLAAMASFVKAVIGRDGVLIIGVSSDWRRRITDFLYRFNRSKMSRSLLFVMGGMVPDDEAYAKRLGCYKRVFVETEGMRKAFERVGTRNVSVYPNCRRRPATPCSVRKAGGGMRLVYFSLISEEKGAQLTIEAAKELPQCSFSFYGPIDAPYEEKFMRQVENLRNVEYRGLFDSVTGDVVSELNQYDIHLFPTMCPNEGVPGVIVETKLAAVPTIASNRGYNSELINDGVDGVLIGGDMVDELISAISSLASSPEQLNSMKKAALLSADCFYIERYLGMITEALQEG